MVGAVRVRQIQWTGCSRNTVKGLAREPGASGASRTSSECVDLDDVFVVGRPDGEDGTIKNVTVMTFSRS